MQNVKPKLMNLIRKGNKNLTSTTQKSGESNIETIGMYIPAPEPEEDFDVHIGLYETPNETEEMVKRHVPSVNKESEK